MLGGQINLVIYIVVGHFASTIVPYNVVLSLHSVDQCGMASTSIRLSDATHLAGSADMRDCKNDWC